MKKNLLNESEIRKFMKFANLKSLTENFVDNLEEEGMAYGKDEDKEALEERAPGLDPEAEEEGGADPMAAAGDPMAGLDDPLTSTPSRPRRWRRSFAISRTAWTLSQEKKEKKGKKHFHLRKTLKQTSTSTLKALRLKKKKTTSMRLVFIFKKIKENDRIELSAKFPAALQKDF